MPPPLARALQRAQRVVDARPVAELHRHMRLVGKHPAEAHTTAGKQDAAVLQLLRHVRDLRADQCTHGLDHVGLHGAEQVEVLQEVGEGFGHDGPHG